MDLAAIRIPLSENEQKIVFADTEIPALGMYKCFAVVTVITRYAIIAFYCLVSICYYL